MIQKKYAGMTIIELIITMMVIAILAVVAVSLYRPFVLKSRRSDGIGAILNVHLLEERYRSINTTFGTLAQINGSATSPLGYYALAISNVSATGYTITATGQGNQANDTEDGTACSSLTLTVTTGTVTRAPAVCWPS